MWCHFKANVTFREQDCKVTDNVINGSGLALFVRVNVKIIVTIVLQQIHFWGFVKVCYLSILFFFQL